MRQMVCLECLVLLAPDLVPAKIGTYSDGLPSRRLSDFVAIEARA